MLEQLLTALVMMIGSYRPEAVTRLVLLACAVLRTRHGHEQGHLSREQYLRTIELCRQSWQRQLDRGSLLYSQRYRARRALFMKDDAVAFSGKRRNSADQ